MTEHEQNELRGFALEMLVSIQEMDDIEMAHVRADEVLMNLLRALGFSDVVAEYDKVGKWYA